jgi:hypothetical protein
MSAHHHPHDHGHSHGHPHQHPAAAPSAPRWQGLLTAGVAPRLAGAAVLLGLLWLGVLWAMT